MKHIWPKEELVDNFTLSTEERALIENKTLSGRVWFSVLLKFFQYTGNFPIGPNAVPKPIVVFISEQLGLPAEAFYQYKADGKNKISQLSALIYGRFVRCGKPKADGIAILFRWFCRSVAGEYAMNSGMENGVFYFFRWPKWNGSEAKLQRSKIRKLFGYRKWSRRYSDELIEWLQKNILPEHLKYEHIKDEVLNYLRSNKIEPPTNIFLERVISSAINAWENNIFRTISSKLPPVAKAEMDSLLQRNILNIQNTEIEWEISYILSENDPLHDENDDNFIGISNTYNFMFEDDERDLNWNDVGGACEGQSHCHLFHDLYDHIRPQLSVNDILKIEEVHVDFKVWYQQFFNLNTHDFKVKWLKST